jgi:hypothetical protein
MPIVFAVQKIQTQKNSGPTKGTYASIEDFLRAPCIEIRCMEVTFSPGTVRVHICTVIIDQALIFQFCSTFYPFSIRR